MKRPVPQSAALIVIDVQKGFDSPIWGSRNNPQAEKNIARLLSVWRSANRPLFHVQHMSKNPTSPLRPGQEGNEFKPAVKPLNGEPVIQKSVNSSFIGTDLEHRLRQLEIRSVVLAGINTNHCVSTTARMAANLGFEVLVISDATATFDMKGPDGRLYPAELMHAVGLAELHGEFAKVVDTETVLTSVEKGAPEHVS